MRNNSVQAVVLFLLATSIRVSVEASTYVVSNRSDSGAGSLRQAILDANDNPGKDTITFNLTGVTPYNIIPETPLPGITDPVFIDGTSQPGYSGSPAVGLVGTKAGIANGLALQASECEVRALCINRFSGNGIQIQGHSNIVAGCYLGTSLPGTTKFANTGAGVTIINGAYNRVGGVNASDRNLISGNGTGLYIVGLLATNNFVLGNLIGTDPDGTGRLGNDGPGVLLSAPRNIIGGTTSAERNVISGNGQSGIFLNDIGATANRVLGNFIGLRVTGAAALSNGVDGVTIYHSRENVIGGNVPGAGNVISGNQERGVLILGPNALSNRVEGNFIGTDVTGRTNLGNRFTGVGIVSGSYNVVGCTNAPGRNLIAGNNQSGVAVDSNSLANVVMGNVIGLDATGTNALPNAWSGVSILAGTNSVVGGTGAGAGNVISGNTQNGVHLTSGTGTLVQGNLIGPDVSGRLGRGNVTGGIRIEGPANLIGGESPAARNVISGNGNSGVLITGAAASNNVVAGNYLGTDINGTARIGNTISGVGIVDAPRNFIGTPAPGGGNLISGNLSSGVYLSGAGATGNRIRGNLIGTDASGTAALGNSLGGVYIYGSGTNFIGGSELGAGNVIAGNSKVGVSIGDPGANGNVLLGNFIGTKADGTSTLGNQWHGVELGANDTVANDNIVGGTAPGEANRIAYTRGPGGYDGVRIRVNTMRSSVRGNAIWGNDGLGIDLHVDGVTVNDVGDGGSRASNPQNFPLLVSAIGHYITAITGSLNSVPGSSFTIDFYGSMSGDPSGFGEGQIYLGSTPVTTGLDGNAAFSALFTNAVSVGDYVTATATDAAGNTSEFSAMAALPPSLDTDGDGLPDDYEMAFGLNPNSSADRDSDLDGDGASNYQEFLAGTRPNDRRSVLRLTLQKQASASLLFDSVVGESYRLESAPTVTGPWTVVADNLAGTGARLRITDATTAAQKFYRLRANH